VVKNPSEAIAFFNFMDLIDSQTNQPILPIYWDDNYVTLLPGEERTFTAKFFLSDFKGEKPILEVRGWNVDKMTVN
jgi:exo-1,4-beta-D-glucosaminidase